MSLTVIQGGPAMLDCPVHGDPSPVLRWVKDGKLLLRSPRMQALHNGSLIIYSITVNTKFTLLPKIYCNDPISRQVFLN